MSAPIAALEAVEAGYGAARVLFGLDLSIGAAEVVTLIGRNGMGKTTAIRTLFGLLPVTGGRVVVRGRDMTGARPHRIARLGLGLVPEGRQIFPRLTVEENLLATAAAGTAAKGDRPPWGLDRVNRLFPRLSERRRNFGTELSGGEQQMLAIGRALMTNPELIVLDEATEGLAPVLRDEIWAAIATLKREGHAILIVDKNLDALMRLADRHVVIERGRVAWTGTTAALRAERAAVERFVEV